MPSFADLLRDHMKKTDMNSDALAQRIGLSHDTITRWMTGKEIPTLYEYVIFCAEALNLDPTEYDEFLEAVPFDSFATLLNKELKKAKYNTAKLAKSLNISEDIVKKTPNTRAYAVAYAKTLGLKPIDQEQFVAAAGFPAFGVLFHKYIQNTGFTLSKLAKQLGIDRTNLNRWKQVRREGGNPPNKPESLEQLAKILHLNQIDTNDFLEAAGFSPKKTLSPCVVGLPIQNISQFFGREDELKRIANLWNSFPLQNIAVIGSQGIGKSSLLNYLLNLQNTVAEDLRPNQRHDWFANLRKAQWAKLDFNNALIWTKDGFFRNLLKRLNIKENNGLHFIDILEQHLDVPTFILLDNVDVGLSAAELDISFWSSLRSLSSENENLAFIITSPKVPELEAKIYGKPSGFFNIFGHVIKLEPLLEEDARELLYFGADQAKLSVPCIEDDIAWILEQSGRWPILLQILCDCRFQALREGKSEAVWKKECLERLSDLSGFKNLTGL
ncbi:helix-turn-helix domain-containing protein [Candidatus Marithrix sp. Canyon 246]|nr:helix-turn-helix transcriptional regulator [Candidatus Marithrix sp. Canyon 246]